MSRVRLSFVLPFLETAPLSGVEREAVQVANALVEQGDDVSIVTTRRRYGGGRVETGHQNALDGRIEVVRLPSELPLSLRGIQPSGAPLIVHGLWSVVQDKDAVVIFNGGWPLTLRLNLFSHRRRVRIAYRTYWHPPRGRSDWANRLRRTVAVDAFRRADFLLVPTEEEADLLLKLTAARRVEIVPPGVDGIAEQCLVNRLATRRGLGVPDDALLAIQLGRPGPFKGTDRAIQAIARARKRGRDIYLLIVGRISDTSWLRERIRESDAQSWSIVTDEVSDNDKFDLLAASDVLLLLSEYEAFGFAALEALACGSAVIALSDYPSARSLARQGARLVSRFNQLDECAAILSTLNPSKHYRYSDCPKPRGWDTVASEMKRHLLS